MDFDPSAFLSMDMTEDRDVEYTAPDVPQGFSPAKFPEGNIVLEGGLQMENELQIPVPVFGLLHEDEPMEEERKGNDNDTARFEEPVHIDTSEQETSSMQQDSPGERALSPCARKAIIQRSLEETRFRKELFNGHFERVKLFRLHCTICDKHLGCAPWFTERQMRTHKLLNVVVCRKCFEFYGDINFPIEDGSELFCCWCGEGGECFCCSNCPKIVCKKCVKRNFGAAKVKEIDQNDDWSCFVCKPDDIFPHRALMVGLQRWGRGLRQLVSMLPKEEKQTKLSMDTSHCCPQLNKEITLVGLPNKSVLSKIPLQMIATAYQNRVREELTRPEMPRNFNNGYNSLHNHASRINSPMNNLSPRIPETAIRVPGSLMTQQLPRAMAGYQVRQMVQRNTIVVNRPSPYPVNRSMTPTSRYPPTVQPPRFAQNVVTMQQELLPYRTIPPLHWARPPTKPSYSHEVIDLDRYSPPHGNLKPPSLDISSLESDVSEVKNILRPTLMMLNNFDTIKNELSHDFGKFTTYYDRLSYNIKIAICNLAKINTELVENQKKVIDSRVSSVVNHIQSAVNDEIHTSGTNNVTSSTMNGPPNRTNQMVNGSTKIFQVEPDSPSKTPGLKISDSGRMDQTSPAVTSSSTGEEVEDLAIAMLCETVLEENKENKDDVNKEQPTPDKKSQKIINKGKRTVRKKPRSAAIQVIDLSDEEDETTFDKSKWCKKFNIVPCKVVLEKLEILKVEVN